MALQNYAAGIVADEGVLELWMFAAFVVVDVAFVAAGRKMNALIKQSPSCLGGAKAENWKLPEPNSIVNFVASLCAGYDFDDCLLPFEVDFQLNRYEHGRQGPFYDFD